MPKYIFIIFSAALLSGCSFDATKNTLKGSGDNDYSTTRSTLSTGEADRDCSDFSTQREAQAFFDSAGSGDPHGLDRDKDGRVCETSP
jgi:PBP1b-binding outer membrane lipoprotein LpoB